MDGHSQAALGIEVAFEEVEVGRLDGIRKRVAPVPSIDK
jgi:hypothetical protein